MNAQGEDVVAVHGHRCISKLKEQDRKLRQLDKSGRLSKNIVAT
jgi:hypothetical protein